MNEREQIIERAIYYNASENAQFAIAYALLQCAAALVGIDDQLASIGAELAERNKRP